MTVTGGHKERIVGGCVVLAVMGLLVAYLAPSHLLTKTITTGGDTASHYLTAQYLRDVLLPNAQVTGWMPGNYAGFPLFLFYFPLPFLIMAVLSYAIPLEIAFKLVTILGTLLLPVMAYWCLRLLRYGFPIPVFGAVLTLPFLFMEANSMWGGNIPSTLAGEFAFSLGFALSVLFIGSVHRGIHANNLIIPNAVLVALIGLSHGYALLVAGLTSMFFVITTEGIVRKVKYLAQVHGLGFLLMGWWIVPLLANLPNNTRFNHIWAIDSLWEVFPVILLPVVVVAVGGALMASVAAFAGSEERQLPLGVRVERVWTGLDLRRHYLWFCVATSVVCYLIAFKVHVVDIRFLPYLQLALCLIAAVELGRAAQAVELRWLSPVVLAAVVVVWVGYHSKTIQHWSEWNYSGFEAKALWPAFAELNRGLAGGVADPRVVYEHSSLHNGAGTTRAFESLPLFSGRSTLEGVYMQSSLSSPFVFYLQSEISHEMSCPLPDYGCSTLNLQSAARHLRLFNVRDVIVVSDEVKAEIAKHPEFALRQRVGPYEAYELLSNDNRYVTPLEYEPVGYITEQWKTVSYRWFKDSAASERHLVFVDEEARNGVVPFQTVRDGRELAEVPRIRHEEPCRVDERVGEQEIGIRTDCIGRPVLVKVSYHPNWTVEGAERIYLASPSFMLIYPQRAEVRLRFAKSRSDFAGIGATTLGVLWVVVLLPLGAADRLRSAIDHRRRKVVAALVGSATPGGRVPAITRWMAHRRTAIVTVVWVAILVGGGSVIAASKHEDPGSLYAKGLSAFGKSRHAEARELFARIIGDHPDTAVASNASYFYAITFFKEERYQEADEAFRRLVTEYADSQWVPEAHYHIGVVSARLDRADAARAAYRTVIDRFGSSRWAAYSSDRLREMAPAPVDTDYQRLYERAMIHFDAGQYPDTRDVLTAIRERYPGTDRAELASYFYAVSFFKERRFGPVIQEFLRFIDAFPESEYVAEAYYHIAVSHTRLNDRAKARVAFERVITDFPASRWAGYSKEALRESAIAQPQLG